MIRLLESIIKYLSLRIKGKSWIKNWGDKLTINKYLENK